MSGVQFELIYAPFSEDQINSIKEYQKSGIFHPFTCSSGVKETILNVSRDGMYCPICSYRQNWVHKWMSDWSWKKITKIY